MNCLIYLRVSTKEQAREGYSIAAQREACIKFIREKGWNFVGEYVDEGESAKTKDRPALQEMLVRVKKDKTIDAVIVHKLDRLARNIEDHAAIRAVLRKHNIQLLSVTENIEDSASGRLIEGILAAIAEFYSANLSNEIKKGMTQKVKEGGWPHSPPLGYKNIRDESGKAKIVIDEEKAPLVKEAFRIYATGEYSLRELEKIMKDKGLRSRFGKPLTMQRFQEMLQNKFYIGLLVWKGEVYKGSHEPIITKELFERVQDVFRLRLNGTQKRKHPHYLRGILFCGECGSRLSSTLAKKRYLYFYCLGRHKGNGCTQPYIYIEKVEREVENLYRRIQLPQHLVESITEDLIEELEERERLNRLQKEIFEKRMRKLQNQQQKLLEAYYAGAIPLELLKKEQNRLTEEIVKCELKLSESSLELEKAEKVIKLALKWASSCYKAYRNAGPQTKRKFNRAFFKKIYFKNKKISDVEYTDLFSFLFSSNKLGLVEHSGLEPLTSCLQSRRSPN